MRKFSAMFAVLCIIAVNVHSKSIYRNEREINVSGGLPDQIPVEVREDLPGSIALDGAQPVLVLKEEVLVPVESLQNLEPAGDVDSPGTIVVEDDLKKGEYVAIIEDDQNQAEEQQPIEEEEAPAEVEDGLRGESADAPVAEQQPQQETVPVEANNNEQAVSGLKQGGSTTARPSLLEQAQQIINNNPFGQFIDSIRRPSTVAPSGEQQAAVETTTNANILQQLQAGVQNIGSQITSAFIPPNQNNLQPAESSPAGTVVRPPNFFEQLQTNFQNTVQGIFRPNTEQSATGGNQPQGPFQAVLSNVQNFLTGNRVENPSAAQIASTSAAPQKTGSPVDDKVDFNKNSGEVIEDTAAAASELVAASAEPAPVAEVQSEIENQDEAVQLVGQESSLETES